ncbi:MAG: hypothetical protein WD873_09255, partial [Candidatus Hydrogenedentales bacterium]
MARRREYRLGIGGEMVPPGWNPKGQRLFLEAVYRHVPEALEDLRRMAPTFPDTHGAALRAWCQQWGFTGRPPTAGGGRKDWLLNVADQMV